MTSVSSIKSVVHSNVLSRGDTVLLLLACEYAGPKSTAEIRSTGFELGVQGIRKWNVSDILGRLRGFVIKVPVGWEIGPLGFERLGELGVDMFSGGELVIATGLRSASAKISSTAARSFIDEAIASLEHRCYRAAVITSWVGAVAVLYEYVLNNVLNQFNAEAMRRNPKWKSAKSFDDLADMKEDTFLDVLHSVSVIGKSVKDELKARLKTRNGAGHPNTFKIGENMVKAHIESLIDNVFLVFK